jgi:hypothetical protein
MSSICVVKAVHQSGALPYINNIVNSNLQSSALGYLSHADRWFRCKDVIYPCCDAVANVILTYHLMTLDS